MTRGDQPGRRFLGFDTDLWLWPSVAGVLALAAGLVLDRIPATPQLSILAWPGDVDAASATLQTVATSAITTTSLTFSLTVVALQLASQQFSPRLLRTFMRDPFTKAVLAILVATFVLAVTVLRDLRTEHQVPGFAMLLVSVLAVVALGGVLGFITHITRLLRVDTMMLSVHDETTDVIEHYYPPAGDEPDEPEPPPHAAQGRTVTAARSGFVRLVRIAPLVTAASRADALVCLEVRPGDHVVRETPIASIHRSTHRGTGDVDSDGELDDAVRKHVVLGYERTMEQDVAFGFRQLTDIAVKALSPGVNDPVTAAHCMGHLADLFVLVAGRRLGPRTYPDDEGAGRVHVPDRDLQYYLDLVCGQIRRSGEREPTVLIAVLRMLRDVAVSAGDDGQRRHIDRQVELVLEDVPDTLIAADTERVVAMAGRVRMALAGDPAAFKDRSGETRSL